MAQTVKEIEELLKAATRKDLEVLERSLAADTRKGVLTALARARARIEAQEAEEARLTEMYAFERSVVIERGCSVVVGLDEVGRGPLAGPLAVGAVVLGESCRIPGLNDSKQIKPEARELIAAQIEEQALAWTVQYVEPEFIDAHGMTASLTHAFRSALAEIERLGVTPDLVLLDGNPMRLDPREVNVIKGDAKCASIAAASIVAKVHRDRLMCDYAKQYPEYHLDECKGYASAAHMDAIREHGLTPLHRRSFCGSFKQESLF